ncbi:MAG: hypothetical protein M8357_00585 [Desulfobulbaceae bacterium]|nr:hypothetical protein [Desulfobulbaceae bacterium]
MSKLNNSFLDEIQEKLQPLNSPEDLVKLGLAGSVKTLANKRSVGTGPDYVRIKGVGIRYPKQSTIDWLKRDTVFVKAS